MTGFSRFRRQPLAAVLAGSLILPGGATRAEDAAATPGATLSVELNTAETVEASCRLTFVVRNGLGQDLGQLVLETVLFTAEGGVADLTLFDFAALPAGTPRVRRFDVAGTACDGLASVLVNGVDTCAGEGVAPGTCAGALALSSRSEIGLDG